MDEVYSRRLILQTRARGKGEAYSHDNYAATTKAATHDYNGTAGYKIVISTQLLRHRSTTAMVACSSFATDQPSAPYTLSYDTSAAPSADGQVGALRLDEATHHLAPLDISTEWVSYVWWFFSSQHTPHILWIVAQPLLHTRWWCLSSPSSSSAAQPTSMAATCCNFLKNTEHGLSCLAQTAPSPSWC